MKENKYLKRLPRAWYQGYAAVFWSMTIENRKTGWLSSESHHLFRETMLHAMYRFRLVCPGYVSMSDHFHFAWIGVDDSTDQMAAATFFRRHFNRHLRELGFSLQKQGHEHVLREEERKRNALASTLYYIFENPVRAKLVDTAKAWRYSGALVTGYPDLDWRDGDDFFERFWKAHAIELEKGR